MTNSTTKNGLFYGWYMVIGLMFMYAATNGISMYAFTIMRPLQVKSFGLDPQSAAFLPTVLFLTVAVVSPFTGRLFDKFDLRKLIIYGTIAIIILTFLQAFIPNYTVLTVYYGVYGMAMTLVGIISFMYLINIWFDKYKGMASGIMLLGSSLGGLVFPKIVAAAEGDWQKACSYLGIAAIVFMIPPLFIVKSKPSDVGSFKDGISPSEADSTQDKMKRSGITLTQALQNPSFYFVLFVTAVLWFCINGYMQNHGFVMKDMNKDAGQSAKILGIFSTMAIIGKLLFGYLSDKFSRRNIMVLSIVMMAVSVYFLKLSFANQSFINAFAFAFGIGFGGAFTIIQVWVADLYAGTSFGAILGVVTMIDTIAGSAGMIILGTMRKNSGSYESGANLLLILCLISIVCAFLVKKPKENVV